MLMTMAAIQFTTVLDFMVIMPLAPQFARVFDLSAQQFGWLISAYTFAAAIAGIVAAVVIDRFERKRLLLAVYVGFVAAADGDCERAEASDAVVRPCTGRHVRRRAVRSDLHRHRRHDSRSAARTRHRRGDDFVRRSDGGRRADSRCCCRMRSTGAQRLSRCRGRRMNALIARSTLPNVAHAPATSAGEEAP